MRASPTHLERRLPLLLACMVALVIIGMGGAFYVRGVRILKGELDDRLRSTAAVAAMQFDGDILGYFDSPEDMRRPVFIEYVRRLNVIRETVPDIRYAYIMRRTEDPFMLSFVVDADSLLTPEQQDADGDGSIGPEEATSLPGDLYDASEVPAMQNEAFMQATVDPEITYDQWGALISGYAPIRDSSGEAVAFLGLDMAAEDYVAASRSMFSGFSVLVLLMIAVCTALIVMVLVWRHRLAMFRELEHERSALVGLALHQLGTPLSIFRWWVEILEERYGDEICEETDACVQMEEGIARLQDVFNDLKEAHDVSQGRIAYQREEASLKTIIEEQVVKAADRLKRHEQSVKVDIPEDIVMKLDRKLIGGVVEELLENAITYSPKGSTTTISALRRRRDAVVSVRDQGCGIPKEDMQNTFKKFVRGASAHKFKAVGNGLGLYIAKGIVEQAGGRIWLESKEGRGTTASFSIPLSRKSKLWSFFRQ